MAKTSLAHRSSCFSLAILKLCTLQPTRDQTNLSSMIYNELQILGQGEEMLCAHHVRRHVILEDVITPVVTPLCLVTRGPFLESPETLRAMFG